MSAIPYSRFRRNPTKVIEDTLDTDKPVTVKRPDGRNFVIVPVGEFKALEETAHLLSSPKNARRLRESLRQAKAGKLREIVIK
jgi:antitoxin YefM